MSTIWLLLAIVFEVAWAIAMKLSAGFTRPLPVAATILFYLLSVVFLALASRTLPLGVAYAAWAGSGVALIAIAGMIWFGEPASARRFAFIALIAIGIVGLKATPSTPAAPPATTSPPAP